MSHLAMDDAKRAATVEHEIEGIRGRLDGLVAELDHRRHRLSPASLFRRHPLWITLVGMAILGGATGAGVLAHRARQHKRHSWVERGRRLQATLQRVMAGKPIERPPNVLLKALIAATSSAAAIAGRRLAGRLLDNRADR